MIVHVVAVGRVRSAALREACDGYAARIRRYIKFELTEVRDAGRRDRDAQAARRTEATALERAIPNGARVVAVTRTGDAGTSDGLARRLAAWQREARDVALIIGGAHGLDNELLRQADGQLSLSPLTLPHELARLVLLEQLYRACTILSGEPYHKGRGT